MNVVYYGEKDNEDIEYLKMLLPSSIKIEKIPPVHKDELISRAHEFHVVIGARLPEEFLRKASELEYFIIPFAGVPPQDKHILERYPGLTVINSHFNSRYVAEHALSLMLACAKRLMPIHNKHRSGDWTPRYDHQMSDPVEGKTLLILGYGHVGKDIAKIAKCFGMRVEAIKRNKADHKDIDFIGTNEDLEDRLPSADHIVITLPLTRETEGYIGEKEFSLMKEGVHIVNVGRGPVIDEAALYSALKEGKLGCVALDTWWNYPPNEGSRSNTMPSRFPLQDFENVIFSPHRASHVKGREKKRMESLAEILESIKYGKKIDTVDKALGY